MTDRLLTEQEPNYKTILHYHYGTGGETLKKDKCCACAYDAGRAACNQEWQEKIKARRDELETLPVTDMVGDGFVRMGEIKALNEFLEALK